MAEKKENITRHVSSHTDIVPKRDDDGGITLCPKALIIPLSCTLDFSLQDVTIHLENQFCEGLKIFNNVFFFKKKCFEDFIGFFNVF